MKLNYVFFILLTFSFFTVSCQKNLSSNSTAYSTLIYKENHESKIKSPDKHGNLQNLLKFALQNNPELKYYYKLYESKLSREKYAGILPNPQISWTYYLRSVETKVGPQRHNFSVSQKVPWLNKISTKTEIAKMKSKVVLSKLNTAKHYLLSGLKTAWFDYYFLGKKIKIYEKTIKIIRQMKELSLKKYQVSPKGYEKYVLLKLQEDLLKNKIKSLQNKVKPLLYKINSYLGGKLVKFDFPQKIRLKHIKKSKKQLLAELKQNNPLLLEVEKQTDLKRSTLNLANLSSYPDFFVKLSYIETGKTDMEVKDNGKDPIMVTVGVSIPIWINENKAEREAVQTEISALQFKLKNTELKQKSILIKAFEGYKDAIRNMKFIEEKLLPSAKLGIKTSLNSYATGKNTVLGFLDFIKTYLKLRLSLEKEKTKAAKYVAIIEKLTGKEQ